MHTQIQYKSINEIYPYENNPRLNENAVESVAESIKQFGFKVPIVIDSNNVIVAGHTRYKASKVLGLTEVPCIVADDLTEDQIKAFRLADNKVSEKAEWDYDKLIQELNDIEIDMSVFDFDFKDFENNSSDSKSVQAAANLKLEERFIVPPFSVLDSKQGYWVRRKKKWAEMIKDTGVRGTAKVITIMPNQYSGGGRKENTLLQV